MAKRDKNDRGPGIRPVEKKQESRLPVDERGEPCIPDDDPEIIPAPEEELETTPPYEPPPPAEGP